MKYFILLKKLIEITFFYFFSTILAGLPTAVVLSGTSTKTTDPAPILLKAPTLI
jgi:hypothetical protein